MIFTLIIHNSDHAIDLANRITTLSFEGDFETAIQAEKVVRDAIQAYFSTPARQVDLRENGGYFDWHDVAGKIPAEHYAKYGLKLLNVEAESVVELCENLYNGDVEYAVDETAEQFIASQIEARAEDEDCISESDRMLQETPDFEVTLPLGNNRELVASINKAGTERSAAIFLRTGRAIDELIACAEYDPGKDVIRTEVFGSLDEDPEYTTSFKPKYDVSANEREGN